jgi:hypothetical protein
MQRTRARSRAETPSTKRLRASTARAVTRERAGARRRAPPGKGAPTRAAPRTYHVQPRTGARVVARRTGGEQAAAPRCARRRRATRASERRSPAACHGRARARYARAARARCVLTQVAGLRARRVCLAALSPHSTHAGQLRRCRAFTHCSAGTRGPTRRRRHQPGSTRCVAPVRRRGGAKRSLRKACRAAKASRLKRWTPASQRAARPRRTAARGGRAGPGADARAYALARSVINSARVGYFIAEL